jgi:deoxycytidine triphosphate deaminase
LIIPPQYLVNLGYSTEILDCSGVKLTLDEVFTTESEGFIDIDTKVIPHYKRLEHDSDGIYHLPQGSYVIRYREYVKVPEDAIALAIPRSSLIRSGSTLFTAVWDPGYEGRGYGLLVVYNSHGIRVRRGAQVAQLVFIKMMERSVKVYRGTYFGER